MTAGVVRVRRRAALGAAAVCGVALSAWGASHAGGPPYDPGAVGAPPAVIPVRGAVLNPSTGAVVWSSVPVGGRVVLNPATGAVAAGGDGL